MTDNAALRNALAEIEEAYAALRRFDVPKHENESLSEHIERLGKMCSWEVGAMLDAMRSFLADHDVSADMIQKVMDRVSFGLQRRMRGGE